MTTRELRTECVSLAPLFGENSVAAWTRALLEDRRWWRDRKAEIAGFGGAMEFRGRPRMSSWSDTCGEGCWEQREEVRRYHLALTTR